MSDIAGGQASAVAAAPDRRPAFIQVAEAAPAPPPAPLVYVSTDQNDRWFQHINELPATVHALGCHTLRDSALHRHGILFHGDTLITDESHLGNVSRDEARLMTAADRESTSAIALEQPALIFLAAGYRVYGHWLVDFIPRVRIARQALGGDFHDHVIPVPATTPGWAVTLLSQLCGVFEDQLFRYDPATHHITFSEASVPTYGHANYHFHPHVAAYWPTIPADRRQRRLCISRLNFEGKTDGVLKNFADRELFERLATNRGYELVYPETLSIREQIDLFGQASHVIGEYGSALHNTLFSPQDAAVGAIRCPNDVQLRIAALKGQKSVICTPEQDWVSEEGVQCYATSEETLDQFFTVMDQI
ncbi:glycosyltransferase 61 family protein [Brevundimonas sp. NIBR11]|uniref:glycosyltransferase family 61 protein n=1 Tax=Brevundimonas sp. NIBR11 TaxID=3015999 RepID=UPI0022EFF038|nr:glycosyltransferase 61 family protein [Brevundimonas sp. NIBR11]